MSEERNWAAAGGRLREAKAERDGAEARLRAAQRHLELQVRKEVREGMPQAEAARQLDWTRARVNGIVKRGAKG